MKSLAFRRLCAVGALVVGSAVHEAGAVTQAVSLNVLNSAVTLFDPLDAGDNLRLDTLVTSGPGSFSQAVTFTLGPSISAFVGSAAWEISTATGTGPRLIGVNIDIFNSANSLVASDSFAGTLAGFALSTFNGLIGPGTYKLVATGTAVRDASLDVSLSFTGTSVPVPVPEPETYALLLTGLGLLRLATTRKKRSITV